ncbi:MAG: PIN domain-containing protein [Acidobacteriota bacterium]
MSRVQILLDTGPLVAYLNPRDRHHEWAREKFSTLEAPLISCEAVLTEACFLLRKTKAGPIAVLDFAARVLTFPLEIGREAPALQRLITRYQDRPMSFADACMVRLSELYEDCVVVTIDADFSIYRRQGRRTIPTISPRSWS